MARVVCAIAFILFAFVYLYYFQADLLFMEQHILSGGKTHYVSSVGTFFIILTLLLLQFCVARLTCFSGTYHTLSYLPSLFVMSFMASGGENFDLQRFSGVWIVVAALLIVAYVAFTLFYRNTIIPMSRNMPADTVFGCLWKNLFMMSVMFMLVCVGGNTNEVLHYRLRMERMIRSKDYENALQVGKRSNNTDESLTMLRAFALSRNRQLGERLFEYPIPDGGSSLLLPNDKNIKCMSFADNEIIKQLSIRKKGSMGVMSYLLYINRQGLAMKAVTDYVLCGYLLDRNLDAFVHEISTKYNLSSPSLPKHYKEALTLYMHLKANPLTVYHDEVMDADYADFQKLSRTYSNPKKKASYIRDSYRGTYWYYYFYGKTFSL